jgi:DNA polymerase I-like protein with 3'-5' exonuclease and polymerase domains
MGIILTQADLNEMVEHYLKQDSFAFDVETMGEDRGISVINNVVWISFATYGRVDVIPMGHPNGDFVESVRPLTGQGQKRAELGLSLRDSDYSRAEKLATKVFTAPPAQLFPKEVFKAVKPLFFSDKVKIGHNLIFDLVSIAKYFGNKVPDGPFFDTMIASFLYDTRFKGKLKLDDCVARELGYNMVKGVGKDISQHSFDEVARYSAIDSKYTWLLADVLKKRIEEAEVGKTMNLEMDVLYVLCHMKIEGAPIDMAALELLEAQLKIQLEEKRAEIYREAGHHFNINSVQEKQAILYKPKKEGGRGLKSKTLTTAGKARAKETEDKLIYSDYSTSAEALQENFGKDELVNLLVDYAELNKLYTTYVIPYLGGEVTKTVNGDSKTIEKESLLIKGRVHCDFVQNGAETGRFSSKNPNLQNVPNASTDNGKAIRNLFVAPPGYKLVVADYAQVEPRILSAFSKDKTMLKAFNNNEDIYMAVANKMGVNRAAGKQLVLAISYGVGPDKIARNIGCKVSEARELIDNFAKEFPSIPNYKAKVLMVAKKHGYVTTVTGRRRYINYLTSYDRELKGGAERQAFNTVIQGTAADIMKIAMVRAHKLIPKEARLTLTVHDELVTMTPEHLAVETENAIREAMEGVNMLKTVPLLADVKVVDRWGEAKDGL